MILASWERILKHFEAFWCSFESGLKLAGVGKRAVWPSIWPANRSLSRASFEPKDRPLGLTEGGEGDGIEVQVFRCADVGEYDRRVKLTRQFHSRSHSRRMQARG